MAQMESISPRFEKRMGENAASEFLRTIERLPESEWYEAIESRIRNIEDRSSTPLRGRDLTEIEELKKASDDRASEPLRDELLRKDEEDRQYQLHGEELPDGEEDVANWIGPKGTWS